MTKPLTIEGLVAEYMAGPGKGHRGRISREDGTEMDFLAGVSAGMWFVNAAGSSDEAKSRAKETLIYSLNFAANLARKYRE